MTTEITTTAHAIARALPASFGDAAAPLRGSWSVGETGSDHACLYGPAELVLDLTWQVRNRLHVQARARNQQRWYGYPNYRDELVEIGLSSDKNARAIAQNIARRLLPKAVVMLNTIAERQQRVAEAEQARLARLSVIAAALRLPTPVPPITTMKTMLADVQLTVANTDDGRVVVTLHGTVDTLAHVLTTIRDLLDTARP